MKMKFLHSLINNGSEGLLFQDQPVSGDLNQGNFAPNQGATTSTPPTIASAATIAPTTAMTFVTGTTQISTITPPLAGYHELTLVFTNAAPGAFLTTGNIQRAGQPVQNIPVKLYYDPVTAKYWVGAVS
jgi:hypothetical protein